MPIIPQAESKLSDSCAAQVFSLLKKMPLVHYINCHRCAVSSAGALPLIHLLWDHPSFLAQARLLWPVI
jgi:hypothetical protein